MRHIETRGEFPGLNEGGVSEHLQCPLVPASGPLTVGRNDETHRGVLTLSPSSLLTGAFRHVDRKNQHNFHLVPQNGPTEWTKF